MPVIALTGATGFVGQTAIPHLHRRFPDAKLRVLVRHPDKRALPPALDECEIVDGDLEESAPLAALVDGADCVVHAAAAIRGNGAGDFERANIVGTRRLVEAITGEAPGTHLIYLSSLAARQPELSWYSASKRAAEELVASRGVGHSILRPPAVYGPTDPALAGLWRMLARGWLVRPGSATALFSMLHVDDLVEAICRLIEHGPTGRIMPLAGPQPTAGWSWSELARIAGQASGRPVRTIAAPATALRLAAATSLVLARSVGRKALLSPGKARELLHPNWVCDNELIEQCLGWRPTTRLERMLASVLSGID